MSISSFDPLGVSSVCRTFFSAGSNWYGSCRAKPTLSASSSGLADRIFAGGTPGARQPEVGRPGLAVQHHPPELLGRRRHQQRQRLHQLVRADHGERRVVALDRQRVPGLAQRVRLARPDVQGRGTAPGRPATVTSSRNSWPGRLDHLVGLGRVHVLVLHLHQVLAVDRNRGSDATTYQSLTDCGSAGSPIDSSTPVTFDAGSDRSKFVRTLAYG